jgi:hypothetical protein
MCMMVFSATITALNTQPWQKDRSKQVLPPVDTVPTPVGMEATFLEKFRSLVLLSEMPRTVRAAKGLALLRIPRSVSDGSRLYLLTVSSS